MIEKIDILKHAADYLDNPWEYDFPWIGDNAEIINIDNGVSRKIRIVKFSAAENDPDRVKITFFEKLESSELKDFIELLPSQIVAGKYILGDCCFILKRL